jgi:hypothetical protein
MAGIAPFLPRAGRVLGDPVQDGGRWGRLTSDAGVLMPAS